MTELTQERLRAVLNYDPDSGLFRWRVSRGRSAKTGQVANHLADGYIRITIDGSRYLAHRLAWFVVFGAWPIELLDHKNGDRSDNRLCNLRLATRTENSRNASLSASNRCGFKGVHHRPTVTYRDGRTAPRASPFCAVIRFDGRQRTLGYFKTPEDAHAAYVAAAQRHFGEFSRSA